MKAVLLRTGSAPPWSWTCAGSPMVRPPGGGRCDSFAGIFQPERKLAVAPIVSLRLGTEAGGGKDGARERGIRRAVSDAGVVRTESEEFAGVRKLRGAGSRAFPPARIPEGEQVDYSGIWREKGFPAREGLGFGVGIGGRGGSDSGSGGSGCGKGGDRSKIGAYYEEMLRSNPGDFLLLRNYGKFLHEVEKDYERAEEYYGRAILANPGDGEVLALYGALVWEKDGDKCRAKSYFDQAVHASPDDCMVMGAYASFMWEAEEDEEEEEEEEEEENVDAIGCWKADAPQAMVAAF